MIGRALLVALVAFGFGVGCKSEDGIEERRAPKAEAYKGEKTAPKQAKAAGMPPMMAPQAAGPKRIVGAVVPLADGFWFFKATGAPAEIGKQMDAIYGFVRSAKFASNPPDWTVPPTWKPGRGNQFSTAAFLIDEAGTIELTVSHAGGNLIENLNRWRGQVGLEPLAAADIATATKEETIDGKKALLVDFDGPGSK